MLCCYRDETSAAVQTKPVPVGMLSLLPVEFTEIGPIDLSSAGYSNHLLKFILILISLLYMNCVMPLFLLFEGYASPFPL